MTTNDANNGLLSFIAVLLHNSGSENIKTDRNTDLNQSIEIV